MTIFSRIADDVANLLVSVSGQAISPPPAFTGETSGVDANLAGVEAIVRGPGISILSGIIVIFVIISILRRQYWITFAMFICIMCLVAALWWTAPQGIYSTDHQKVDNLALSHTFHWLTYGEGIPSMQQSDLTPGWGIVYGYVLSASLWVKKILIWSFESGLLPIYVVVCIMAGSIATMKSKSAWNIGISFMTVFLFGVFALYPMMKLDNNMLSNPVVNRFREVVETPDAQSESEGAMPMAEAWIFQTTTSIATSLGHKLTISDPGPAYTIFKAANNARIDSTSYDNYARFSENCFASIVNLGVMTDLSPFQAQLAKTRDDRATVWNAEFNANRHALSKASDALFKNVGYDAYIFNDQSDIQDMNNGLHATYGDNKFDGTMLVDRLPEPYVSKHAEPSPHNSRWLQFSSRNMSLKESFMGGHPNDGGRGFAGLAYMIFSGNRNLDRWFPADNVLTIPVLSKSVLLQNAVLNQAVGEHYNSAYGMYMPGDNEVLRWRPYCSSDNAANMDAKSGKAVFSDHVATTIRPDDIAETLGSSAPAYSSIEALNAGDMVRYSIARRYMFYESSETQEMCKKAAKDGGSNPDLWGCLVAGHYNAYQADSNFAHIMAAQRLFDNAFRAKLDAATNNSISTGYPTRQSAVDFSFSNGFQGKFEGQSADGTVWPGVRYFTDTFMLAPGIQAQVGLYAADERPGVTEGSGLISARDSDDAAKFFGMSLVQILAKVSAFMASAAVKVWPYVVGYSYFFIVIAYIPHAFVSLWPGKFFMILEWAKAALWVSTWPIIISWGMATLNNASNYGLDTLFMQAGGGGDVANSLQTMWGATLITGAPFFTAMLIIVGGNGLVAGVGSIVAGGFKILNTTMMLPMQAGAFLAGGMAGKIASQVSKSIGEMNENMMKKLESSPSGKLDRSPGFRSSSPSSDGGGGVGTREASDTTLLSGWTAPSGGGGRGPTDHSSPVLAAHSVQEPMGGVMPSSKDGDGGAPPSDQSSLVAIRSSVEPMGGVMPSSKDGGGGDKPSSGSSSPTVIS